MAATITASVALCLCALMVALPEQRTWAAPTVAGEQLRLPTFSASGALPASPAMRGVPTKPATTGRAAWGSAGNCAAILCALSLAHFASRASSSRVTRFNADEDRKGYRIRGAPGRPGSPGHPGRVRWCMRFRRRIRIRVKVEGSTARPRLAVFRSLQHTHVNVVDDTIGTGVTLLCSTTKQKHNFEAIKEKCGANHDKYVKTWGMEAAEIIGKDVAARCLEQNITKVVFDRGGFPYEGRVKALAEAARSAGLQF